MICFILKIILQNPRGFGIIYSEEKQKFREEQWLAFHVTYMHKTPCTWEQKCTEKFWWKQRQTENNWHDHIRNIKTESEVRLSNVLLNLVDSVWMIQCKSRMDNISFTLIDDLMLILPLRRKNNWQEVLLLLSYSTIMEKPVDELEIIGHWRIMLSCFSVCDNEGNIGIVRLTG